MNVLRQNPHCTHDDSFTGLAQANQRQGSVQDFRGQEWGRGKVSRRREEKQTLKIQVRECSLGAGTGLSPATQAETHVDKVALQELSRLCLVTAARPTMIKLGRPPLGSGNRGGGGARQSGEVGRVAQASGDPNRDAWRDPGSHLSSLS